MPVFVHDPLYLCRRPSYIGSRLFAFQSDLMFPQFALVIAVKRQRGADLFQSFWPFGPAHQYCRGNEDEVSSRVNYGLKVNSLEVRGGLEPVPEANSLSDGFLCACALNSIVTDLAFNHLPFSAELVITTNGHERTTGNAIRSLQYNRTCA